MQHMQGMIETTDIDALCTASDICVWLYYHECKQLSIFYQFHDYFSFIIVWMANENNY